MRTIVASVMLLLLAVPLRADQRVNSDRHLEFFGLVGYGQSLSPGMDQLPGWPAFAVGAGYEMTRHITVEAIGGYHSLGKAGVIYFPPNGDFLSASEKLTLISMTAGLTLASVNASRARPTSRRRRACTPFAGALIPGISRRFRRPGPVSVSRRA